MKKVISIVCTAALCVLLLAGCGCNHNWKAATCLDAQVCTLCQEVGEPAFGHNWQDATCEAPKTCANCGETEGEALGHAIAFDGAAVVCSVCRKDLTEETETLVQDERFLFTPEEFMERLLSIAETNGHSFTYTLGTRDRIFCASIERDGYSAIVQFFGRDHKPLTEADKNNRAVWCVYLNEFAPSDKYLRCYFIMACDPQSDRGEAYSLDMSLDTAYWTALVSGGTSGYKTSNELHLEYSVLPMDETYSTLMYNLGSYASDFR